MILPTIHTNGTSPDDLLAGYRAAAEAVEAAREVLGKVEFNARDYYPQGPDAWTKAQTDRAAMFAVLDNMQEELLTHVEVAYAAVAARDERRACYAKEVAP